VLTQPPAAPTQITAPPQAPPPPPAGRVAAPPPRPAAQRAPAPPRKGGGNAGLLVALLLIGFVAFAGVGVAGWWFFLRQPTTTTTGGPSPAPTTPTPVPSPTSATAIDGDPVVSDAGLNTPPSPFATPGPTLTPGQVVDDEPTARATPGPRSSGGRRSGDAGTQVADGGPIGGRTSPSGGEHAPDLSYLDEEPASSDPDIGGRVADAYRSKQGWNSGGSHPASGGRFRARARSPQARSPLERAAIATLRHVIVAEMAYNRKTGRYGTFEELKQADQLRLDVGVQARAFVRRNYRFALTVESDDFVVEAIPDTPGLRRFKGDSSEFITDGSE
jgi:hypothetical protein